MEQHKVQLSATVPEQADATQAAAEPPAADSSTPAPDAAEAADKEASEAEAEAEPMDVDGKAEPQMKRKKAKIVAEALNALDVHESTGMMAYTHAGAVDSAVWVVRMPDPVVV